MDETLEYQLNSGEKSLVEMLSEYTDSQINDMHRSSYYGGDSSFLRKKYSGDNPLIPYIVKFYDKDYSRYFFTEQSPYTIKYDKSGLNSEKTKQFFENISYAIIDKDGNLYKALVSDVMLADWLRKNKIDINGSVSVMFLCDDDNKKITGVDFFDTAYSKEADDRYHFVTINERQARTMFNICKSLAVSLENELFRNPRLGFVRDSSNMGSNSRPIMEQVRYDNLTTLVKELGVDFNLDKVESLIGARKR